MSSAADRLEALLLAAIRQRAPLSYRQRQRLETAALAFIRERRERKERPMIAYDPDFIFIPMCPHCATDDDVFLIDDADRDTFACDWCGSVTSDHGATWSEPAVPEDVEDNSNAHGRGT